MLESYKWDGLDGMGWKSLKALILRAPLCGANKQLKLIHDKKLLGYAQDCPIIQQNWLGSLFTPCRHVRLWKINWENTFSENTHYRYTFDIHTYNMFPKCLVFVHLEDIFGHMEGFPCKHSHVWVRFVWKIPRFFSLCPIVNTGKINPLVWQKF